MRFGRTKGEIQVEKGDFQGDLVFLLRVLDRVWESATPPTHTWEKSPKKSFFFFFFFWGGGSPKVLNSKKRDLYFIQNITILLISSHKASLLEASGDSQTAENPSHILPPALLADKSNNDFLKLKC